MLTSAKNVEIITSSILLKYKAHTFTVKISSYNDSRIFSSLNF